MKKLECGDTLVLVTAAGAARYEVVNLEVVGDRDLGPLAPRDETRLTLLTCWPFDGLRRTDLRYVVTCRAG